MKLLVPMVVGIAPKNVTLVKLAQLNAPEPMLVIELGIITLVKLEELTNEYEPIVVTELGIVMLVKPE